MREIKFRGKRLDNGEWVYGSLINAPNDMFHEAYISVDEYALFDEKIGFCNDGSVRVLSKSFPVNPKTVGQYTGLKDKNGKEIYEGDIFITSTGVTAVVEWEKEGRFLGFTVDSEKKIVYISREPAVEIIGNIHDQKDGDSR